MRKAQGSFAVIILLLAAAIGGYALLDAQMHRVTVFSDYPDRPEATPGQDWLIVGSDSREGLTEERRDELGTGDAQGRRTDTMMLLHIPDSDTTPTLVSLPRDSYVPIPGHGRGKLNASYAIGGPQLLTQTVEIVTGIRVDHYVEIGFGGFAKIVEAVGGVELCPEEPIHDPKASLDIPAGCQTLNGAEALGYVRTRASALGDLDRVQRQREFLSALIDKATSPGILLNPLRSIPLAVKGVDALEVGQGDHLYHLLSLAFAMRDLTGGGGTTTTVPVAATPTIEGVGSVVKWDTDKALALFNALAADQPVKGLVEEQPGT